MSILSKFIGSKDGAEIEEDTKDVRLPVAPLETIPPRYDITRERTFYMKEYTTITHETGEDFVTIEVDTPATTIDFKARINGYTSRFGELDVQYISVSGHSVSLHHEKDNGNWYVRNLFYYGDVEGVGGESTFEDQSSGPCNPVWSREENLGETITVQETKSLLEVYDWREQMLTHNQPTPHESEIVIRYKDSTSSGGGRSGVYSVVNGDMVPIVGTVSTQFIAVDVEDAKIDMYAKSEDGPQLIRLPLGIEVENGDAEWQEIEEIPRVSQVDNVIWVRDPDKTWLTVEPREYLSS